MARTPQQETRLNIRQEPLGEKASYLQWEVRISTMPESSWPTQKECHGLQCTFLVLFWYFFVLVGFVCFYLGVGCLKERKYMRLGGLGGKEDLEGDRGLERM